MIGSQEGEGIKNNLIISGVEMYTNDVSVLKEGVINFIRKEIEIEAKISANTVESKTCLVKMEKIQILKNKTN